MYLSNKTERDFAGTAGEVPLQELGMQALVRTAMHAAQFSFMQMCNCRLH